MLAEFSSLQHCRQSRNAETDVRSDFQEKLFRNNFSLIRFSCCWLFQQLSIIWFSKIVGNCSGCWELSSFSPGERLSPKLAVANRKIVGNSKPKSWYGSTFGLSQGGRLYLLKNPAVTHAGGIFLSSALPAEPECWSWCPIWFSRKVVPEQLSFDSTFLTMKKRPQ